MMLSVLDGAGAFSSENGDHAVTPGSVVVYAPRELHGMRATGGRLVVLATIAPRPVERGDGG